MFAPLTGSAGRFKDDDAVEIQDIDLAGLSRRSYSHGILATADNREICHIVGNLSRRDRSRFRHLIGEVISL